MPRSASGSCTNFLPSRVMEPLLGDSLPNSIFKKVDLPQPDAPTIEMNSPRSTVLFNRSRTRLSPYDLDRFFTVIKLIFGSYLSLSLA